MTNSSIINLAQRLPEYVASLLHKIEFIISKSGVSGVPLLRNIDHFPSTDPKDRHALISLSPEAWLDARSRFPNIRFFNYLGLTYEIVRALNENGYRVDIADFCREQKPDRHYDLFVGHGGKCRMILDNLPEDTPVLQYVSGVHWETFNNESSARYEYFSQRNKIPLSCSFRRSFDCLTEGEDYLSSKADRLFTIQCPRMIASYGKHIEKFYYTGLGAYLDDRLTVPPECRDFDHGRTNFLYVGGTGGNIQKGLDVLIDAFAACPDLHLYIYCKVENEILKSAKHNLNRDNIHYIYHWRLPMLRSKLAKLLRSVVFTAHAPINIGMGTAFMASLGSGFVPVGYVDYPGSEDSAVLTDSWRVEDLSKCIRAASLKSPNWCRNASHMVTSYYQDQCTAESFRMRFAKLVQSCTRKASANP